MKTYSLSLPFIGLLSGTRAMIGSGLAFLLSDKIHAEQRHAIGWTLLGVGALVTIPIIAMMINNGHPMHHHH